MPADAATCPNEPLRVGRSAALPDCRAYELVTPEKVDAAGGNLEFTESLATAFASNDGEHLVLHALTVFFEPGSHHLGTDAVFSRTAGGWLLHSLTAPGMEGETFQPELLSPTFSTTGFLAQRGLVEAGQLAFDVGPVGGPYTPIAREIPAGTREAPVTTYVAGANAGVAAVPPLNDVVLSSTDHELLPAGPERSAAEEAPPEQPDLYAASGGRLRLVNLNGEGKLTSPCGAQLGAGANAGNAVNAVSADGSRIIFTSPVEPKPPGCTARALYMRAEGRETVDVSAPEEGVAIPPAEREPVLFDGASADGSRVFFTSESALTSQAGAGPYLYEYRTAAPAEHRLRLIADSVGTATAQSTNPEVLVSENGAVVYYAATEPLEVQGQPRPVSGLFRYDSSAERSTYVASPTTGAVAAEPLYTSADGRFLTFEAGREGVQLLGPEGLEVEPRGVGNQQLYRYDAATGSVMCVSCGAGFAPPSGRIEQATADPAGIASVLSVGGGLATAVDISSDGSRVFFQTSARLASTDTNEATQEEIRQSGSPNRGMDVYEWEADGTEDGPGTVCHAPVGCTFLLSAGEAVGAEQFLGASKDGRDVFLSSAAPLVAGAPSGFTSVYDARIGGGFAQKAGAVECTSCQGVGNPPPLFGTPSSASFAGAGNSPPPAAAAAVKPKPRPKPKPKPRCRRGYRRSRRGRCVRVAHKSARSHR
jgi:hypothetical protein